MKKKYGAIAASFLLTIFITLILLGKAGLPRKGNVAQGALSLIIEPDDGIAPVVEMIAGAHRSVDMVMYELDDPRVEQALVAAEARGVAVRVILSSGYNGASSTVNAAAYEYLRAHDVPVRWSPGYFSLTHQKTIIADAINGGAPGSRALIMTFNLVAKYYPTGRDFAVADTDPRDVAAMEDTFNDDWNGAGGAGNAAQGGNNGDQGDDLLWSPGSEDAIIDLIRGARKSLFIYNEEMADDDVTKALIDAARRGVAVRIVMTGSGQWKWAFAELATAGALVRTFADDPAAPLYIHAKMIAADADTPDARAFVGSENFSKGSLYNNRELGMVTADQGIIAGLVKTFSGDWQTAAPFVLK